MRKLTLRDRALSFWAALLLASLGLLLTGLLGAWMQERAKKEGQVWFDRYADKLEADMSNRFVHLLGVFRGVNSYFSAAEEAVTRDRFRVYMAARRIHEEFPGLRGVGFIQRVPRAELDAFVAAERADEAPGFQVKTQGNADDLFITKYIEPLAHNERAWGFDVGSEQRRREAAQTAIDTGRPSLTRVITLVQDGRQRPAYLLYLPAFRWASKIDTMQDRRHNLKGLIYSPIVIEDFLGGIGEVADNLLHLQVFDGAVPDQTSLVFDLAARSDSRDGPREVERSPRYQRVRVLNIAGRDLSVKVGSSPAFERLHDGLGVGWLWGVGVLLSGLLGATVLLLMSGRLRALNLAEGMTSDLLSAKSRAEAALRDSKVLLDAMHRFNLISIADRSGRILEVNEAFCTISGYDRQELIGQDHRIVNSGLHGAAFWAEMWQTIRGGKAWEADVCNRRKDGELYWVKSTVVPMYGDDGEIARYLSIRTDITAGKHQQEALHRMTERFQLAIDGGNDGLWDWFNVNDHKMWWSPQLYRMLGYEPDEFPVTMFNFEALLSPGDQQPVMAAFERTMRTGEVMDMNFRVKTKSGTYRWVRCRGKVFYDADGYAARMAGSLQDIHERRAAEDVVQKHSEQLSAIFSLSPDGFVSFAPDGTVNYVSSAFLALTGIQPEAVLCEDEATFLRELFAQCASVPGIRTLSDLLDVSADGVSQSTWQSKHQLVLELKAPQGRMLALSLYRSQGDVVSTLVLVRDVTHEAEVDRMKSAFLSMAAHELRTPMASIYGFVELMLTRELKADKQRDILGKVYRQCEVMVEIINELLDLARIESKRGADFDCRETLLSGVVEELIRDFKPPPGRDSPALLGNCEGQIILVDGKKMRQALLNVISNAYKYSPQGGHVSLSFPRKVADDGVEWIGACIRDQGIGMSPDQLRQWGERFFRADKSGAIPGTGLGVCIVKEIMEVMGGSVTVESALGEGTAVTLWSPLVRRRLEALPGVAESHKAETPG